MKKIIGLSLLSTIILFSACATNIKIKLLKAPEINLGSRRKIAILNFDSSGYMSDLYSRNYSLSYLTGKRISEKIIEKLIENKHFTVVEREELSKVLQEQSLSGSGFIDSSSTIKLGKLLGVDAIMMGSGNYNVYQTLDRQKKSINYPDKTLTYDTANINQIEKLNISFRIVDTTTGEILGSKTLSNQTGESSDYFPLKGTAIFSNVISSSPIYTDPFNPTPTPTPIYNQLTFYTTEEKLANMTNWKNSVEGLADSITNRIVKQIAPYYVEEQREIKEGTTDSMKQALQMVNKGDWENAKYLWESTIKDTSKDAVNNYTDAMYNLGIYYELNNDFNNSAFYFDQAYKYSGNQIYLNYKKRVESRKEEVDELKSQGRDNDTGVNVKRIPVEQQKDNIDHAQLASKFYSSGRFEEAITEYQKAIEQEPDNSSFHNNLAIIYYSLKQYDNAIKQYNASILLNPNEPGNYYNLGLTYHARGDLTDAKIQYGKACKLGFNPACDLILNMK